MARVVESADRRRFIRLSAAGGAAVGLAGAVPRGFSQPAPPPRPGDGQTVTEPERDVPVWGQYDVVVVGGGIAGVAAAVAAARNGASTCLLEKEFALGGLATLGNVVVYLPLCDGMGNQVIAGIGEELLRLSVADGFNPIPACWLPDGDMEQRRKVRYRVTFNPASYMLALEEWVLASGVHLRYDVRFCTVVKRGDTIQAVVVESKSGRSAVLCRAVVDASGDADVCARAGEPTVSVRTNVAAGWFYTWDRQQLRLVPHSEEFGRDPNLAPKGERGFAGDDADDVTAQVIESRKGIRRRLEALRGKSPDKPLFAAILPTIPSFRMTRRLHGAAVVRESDDRRWCDGCVGMTGDWRKAGPIYFLPLGCLVGVVSKNLTVAGRCISADGPAWDVTRVIPTCAVTGEAAGTAAALAARDCGGDVSRLPLHVLQRRLQEQGVPMDRRLAR
ncbi:MAG: FAD-dependent oxidoreductase [Lentisphaeria bacterium]|nr:FAD-dependent oxidoreductase [Lentisphaeria bacterium]